MQVAVPPPPLGSPPGPHGSHGQPPSYAGTDDDFLFPADPHFASFKTWVDEGTVQHIFDNRVEAEDGFRSVADTLRDVVLSRQLEPLNSGSRTVTFDEPKIRSVLDRLESFYRSSSLYPRPGLYGVVCQSFFSFPFGNAGCTDADNLFRLFPISALIFTESQSEATNFPGGTGQVNQRRRSNASFFIPRSPAGKQLRSAKLRASFFAAAPQPHVPTAFQLNGKPPETIESLSCTTGGLFPEVASCQGMATWDFTQEALAAQGGQLTVVPEISPLFSGVAVSPTRTEKLTVGRLVILPLAINYPWRHSFGEPGSLTMTFDEGCPQQPKLEVMDEAVLPVIPPENTIPPPIRNLEPKATIKATVTTCPAQGGGSPAEVEVTFEVRPPAAGTAEDGGHAPGHIPEPRPLTAFGSFERPGGPKDSRCTVTTFNADGMGTCSVAYHSSEVSGVETIEAKAVGFPNAEAKVTVQVPGLVNLAESPTPFLRFFRLVGQTATHPDNHWGTPNTRTNIQLVALDFLGMSCDTRSCAHLRINDMSLPLGGMFDICATWNPESTCARTPDKGGHFWHRTGTGVDIGRTACTGLVPEGSALTDCPATERVSVSRLFISRRCFSRGKATMARETNYHCEWPE